jgi:hypothetical protein|tara:strand:+ start:320 stop:550 length:231 start_codon:yes stop_codon:yes gene_type:complete
MGKKTIIVKKDKDGKPKVINPKDYEGKLMTKKMSGGMAMGGGKKNYKMSGTMKAKTGKLVGKQKNLPKHLQKAILA